MSNEPSASAAPTSASELGVVDPIRLPKFVRPGLSRSGATWDRLPLLGRVFVVLAVVDVAARALGLFGMGLHVDLAFPISLITAFIPQTLLILLPALLLLRRPDAATATPLVLRGAIVLALVALITEPISSLLFGLPGDSGFLVAYGVAIARTILSAVGWLAIAVGLGALTTGLPGPAIAGLSNLVFAALLAAAIVSLALVLVLAPPDLGEPSWNTLETLANALYVMEAGVLAYLARVIIRGTEDVRRPASARYLATGATVTGAAITAIVGAVGAVALVHIVFAIPGGPIWGEVALAWIAGWPVTAAILVALALGLADNSVRLPRSGGAFVPQADSAPAPVHWPAPGGDVPAYRPVEPAPTTAPARNPRRRKSKDKEPRA